MSNKAVVPQAQEALEKFKYEVANEIGVPLKQGYNGDLTSAQNGYVGGYMVKKMIEKAEQEMSGAVINYQKGAGESLLGRQLLLCLHFSFVYSARSFPLSI